MSRSVKHRTWENNPKTPAGDTGGVRPSVRALGDTCPKPQSRTRGLRGRASIATRVLRVFLCPTAPTQVFEGISVARSTCSTVLRSSVQSFQNFARAGCTKGPADLRCRGCRQGWAAHHGGRRRYARRARAAGAPPRRARPARQCAKERRARGGGACKASPQRRSSGPTYRTPGPPHQGPTESRNDQHIYCEGVGLLPKRYLAFSGPSFRGS